MNRYKVIKSFLNVPIDTIVVDIDSGTYGQVLGKYFIKFRPAVDILPILELLKDTVEDRVWEAVKFFTEPCNKVTSLEIKQYLREEYPDEYLDQNMVSRCLHKLVQEGKLSYTDNGNFRIYSLINKKKMTTAIQISVSPTNLVKKIEETKGKLITVKFIKDVTKEVREANGIYTNRTPLGNINVQEYKYFRHKKSGLLGDYVQAKKKNNFVKFLEKYGKNAINIAERTHEYTQILPKNILEVKVSGETYINNKPVRVK